MEAPTRYEQLAVNYLALVQRASIRLWLRANERFRVPLGGVSFYTEFSLHHPEPPEPGL